MAQTLELLPSNNLFLVFIKPIVPSIKKLVKNKVIRIGFGTSFAQCRQFPYDVSEYKNFFKVMEYLLREPKNGRRKTLRRQNRIIC